LVAIQNLYWALDHQHNAVVLGLVGIFTSGNGLDAKIGIVGIYGDQSWEIPELRWDLDILPGLNCLMTFLVWFEHV
jgi:hypothetical protein